MCLLPCKNWTSDLERRYIFFLDLSVLIRIRYLDYWWFMKLFDRKMVVWFE
jgi:hypothetical protein